MAIPVVRVPEWTLHDDGTELTPPPTVHKNMELSVLLFEHIERDKDLRARLDGHIVCHVIEGDDIFNYYNRSVAKRRAKADGKPVVEIVWPADWRDSARAAP